MSTDHSIIISNNVMTFITKFLYNLLGPDYEYIDTDNSKASQYGYSNGDVYATGNQVDMSKFNIDEAYDEDDIINFDPIDYSKYVNFIIPLFRNL